MGKVRLGDLWGLHYRDFISAPSPVYGESDVTLRYFSIDLLWRPLGHWVRFVLVRHPVRGKLILMCTDLNLTALEIIAGYGLRFKIELGFRHAIHTLGAYAYHFWMSAMTPLPRRSGNQYKSTPTIATCSSAASGPARQPARISPGFTRGP